MIYSHDRAINLPVQDLYDTQMMTTKINAAREMYNRAQEQQDQFFREYDNFISPSDIDTENYYKLSVGKIKQGIDDLYRQGIDPLRNPEGRARIRQLINSVPYADLQRLRSSAKAQEEYNQAKRSQIAQGLFNEDFERLEGGGPINYDTLKNGIWTRQSPTPYKSMADLSEQYYNDIQPGIIEEGTDKNGVKYQMLGISRKNIEDVADQRMLDIINTPQGQLIYKQLLEKNSNDSGAARTDFRDMIIAANINRTMNPRKIVDPLWQAYRQDRLARENLDLQRQRLALQRRQQPKQPSGQDLEDLLNRDVFRESEQKWRTHANYNPLYTHYLRIVPKGTNIRTVISDSGAGAFQFTNMSDAKVYRTSDVYGGKTRKKNNDMLRVSKVYDKNGNPVDIATDNIRFVQTGQLHAKRDGRGELRYFANGYLQAVRELKDENGNVMMDKDGRPALTSTILYTPENNGKFSSRVSMEVEKNDRQPALFYDVPKTLQ